jgi:hypothetical protein
MPELRFPAGRVVGTLEWLGATGPGRLPVLATGAVSAPDGAEIHLDVHEVHGLEPHDDGWTFHSGTAKIDLGFVRELPADAIFALDLGSQVRGDSMDAIVHLAPGLRQLCLSWTEYGDEVIPHLTQLTKLRSLQTFGNHFTDEAVQALVALKELERLALEEETLTARAFTFTTELPRLNSLGLQDVPITEPELATLRAALPDVQVG